MCNFSLEMFLCDDYKDTKKRSWKIRAFYVFSLSVYFLRRKKKEKLGKLGEKKEKKKEKEKEKEKEVYPASNSRHRTREKINTRGEI